MSICATPHASGFSWTSWRQRWPGILNCWKAAVTCAGGLRPGNDPRPVWSVRRVSFDILPAGMLEMRAVGVQGLNDGDSARLDLACLQRADSVQHPAKDGMKLLVHGRFQNAVLDHEIELLLHIGGKGLGTVRGQAAVMDGTKTGDHRGADRGHAVDHALVSLPFGAVV